MPNFKDKNRQNKNNYFASKRTLDEMHYSQLRQFDKQKQECQKINDELESKKENLKNLEPESRQYVELTKEIDELKQKQKSMDYEFNMVTYFLQVGTILDDYYKDNSSSKNENENEKIITQSELSKMEDHNPDKNIENVFPIKKQKSTSSKKKNKYQTKGSIIDIINNMGKTNEDNNDKKNNDEDLKTEKNKINRNKGTLNKEYTTIIQPENYSGKKNRVIFCDNCNVEMSLIRSEGLLVCSKCGATEYIVIDSDVPSHNDNVNEKQKSPYKKVNHFIEVLNKFQCKGCFNEEKLEHVINTINKELTRKKIDKKYITVKKIRELLKKNKMGKYYEYTQYIYCKITGIDFPKLKHHDEENAKKYFKMILEPFEKYRPPSRVNLLNYECILNKILQLLGYDDYAKRCYTLKDDEKLSDIDRIWEKICSDLNWTFKRFGE